MGALERLRRYVTGGRFWRWTVNGMWEDGGPAMCAGLEPVVLARACDEELRDAVDGDWGPWSAWAEASPRIRAALDAQRADWDRARARSSPVPSRQSLRQEASARLVAAVERGGAGRGFALEELGRRRDPVLLDLAENVVLRNAFGTVPGLGAALDALGVVALERARGWAGGGDAVLAHRAVGVLAGHGTMDDVPVLLGALTAAAEERAWCAAETPARGLGRLGVAAAVPALRFLWAETTHSYARADYLAGLRGAAGPAAADVLDEAVDDCEAGVRESAVPARHAAE
ncbi:hypothetical protein AB0K00_48315 [Dactylosporangium sp. NPDC049525]|uniref:hypothetical protein n=1 Tax=Dactylosporangium sp. NPDC049525 TaxID=3154730 RepID=UPI003447CF32